MKKFDPQIYPRKLFVLESEEDMKLFQTREGFDLEPEEGNDASVWKVVEKSTDHKGVAVFVWRAGFDTIAHESDHIVNIIFNDLGIDIGYEHDEHHAYMLGWVAKCIGEGLNLKVMKCGLDSGFGAEGSKEE